MNTIMSIMGLYMRNGACLGITGPFHEKDKDGNLKPVFQVTAMRKSKASASKTGELETKRTIVPLEALKDLDAGARDLELFSAAYKTLEALVGTVLPVNDTAPEEPENGATGPQEAPEGSEE